MNKVDIFNQLMTKAKYGGYTGPDGSFELGRILDGTNYYAIIFREDFAKALWGEKSLGLLESLSLENKSMMSVATRHWPEYKKKVLGLLIAEDKWKYLEENTL